MRARKLTTWLVLGTAVALAYAARRRRGAPLRRAVPAVPSAGARGTPAELDPTTLGRDDEAGEMFVEAIADWDLSPGSELDLDVSEPRPGPPAGVPIDRGAEAWGAEARTAEPGGVEGGGGEAGVYAEVEPGEPSPAVVYGDRRAGLGAGDLYGVHVVPAVERELPDDDRAQAEGESWLEHLEASSAELGPEPEHVLDIVDDSDLHAGHHKTETDDTPVADHGSGGPRGL